MTEHDTSGRRTGLMRVNRSRGALSGLLLLVLGVWGALVPFIGPYFHYAYTPDSAWTWTAGRFWLEVLPGAAAVVAGLLLLVTANRAVGVLAGYLGAAAGAWFVVGPVLGRLWGGAEGTVGSPTGGQNRQVWEQIGFFTGLGVVILFVAAQALGRFTVRSVRDVRAAERHAGGHDTDRDDHRDTTFAGNRTAAQPGPAAVGASSSEDGRADGAESAQGPWEPISSDSRGATRMRPQG